MSTPTLDPESRTLSFWVHQKQSKGKAVTREVGISPSAADAVNRYLRKWGIPTKTEPTVAGSIWRGTKGAKPLTRSGTFQLVRRLCKEVGVPNKGLHGFRRSFAVNAMRAGANEVNVLHQGGWNSNVVFKRYIAGSAASLSKQAHQVYAPSKGLNLK